jgi:hypothetical protein
MRKWEKNEKSAWTRVARLFLVKHTKMVKMYIYQITINI